MKPEDLQNWQPQASLAQLNDFIQQNATLMILLEEAWAKFIATQTPQAPAEPPSPPPENTHRIIDWDNLEHFPVSQEEMIEFLNHFEKERFHNDRPFGDHVQIQEQNWQIEGLETE